MSFIQPYKQERLQGAEGLLASDIARSLGVEKVAVFQKIKRTDIALWERQGWTISAYTLKVPRKMGRPQNDYVFSRDAARAFVAKWNNEIGIQYLAFLMKCEDNIRMIGAAVQNGDMIPAKRGKRPYRCGIVEVRMQRDLFGEMHPIPYLTHKLKKDLTPAEQREYRMRHRTKITKGLTRAQDEDMDRTTFMTEKNAKALTAVRD